MKKERTLIYIKLTPERNETLFSGIMFVDFINYLSVPIDNILLLKADYVGDNSQHNFELLEGKDCIAKFALEENIYNYGDFCFVDYANVDSVGQLNGLQIAELLYLVHMYKPLNSPFFNVLQNRFAYLSHDDGYYCKVYCKEREASVLVILNKIRENIIKKYHCNPPLLPDNIVEEIYQLSTEGLTVDLDNISHKDGIITINFYVVGEYKNMDHFYDISKKANFKGSLEARLSCSDNEWSLDIMR